MFNKNFWKIFAIISLIVSAFLLASYVNQVYVKNQNDIKRTCMNGAFGTDDGIQGYNNAAFDDCMQKLQ
jgi:hypothetical protein